MKKELIFYLVLFNMIKKNEKVEIFAFLLWYKFHKNTLNILKRYCRTKQR